MSGNLTTHHARPKKPETEKEGPRKCLCGTGLDPADNRPLCPGCRFPVGKVKECLSEGMTGRTKLRELADALSTGNLPEWWDTENWVIQTVENVPGQPWPTGQPGMICGAIFAAMRPVEVGVAFGIPHGWAAPLALVHVGGWTHGQVSRMLHVSHQAVSRAVDKGISELMHLLCGTASVGTRAYRPRWRCEQVVIEAYLAYSSGDSHRMNLADDALSGLLGETVRGESCHRSKSCRWQRPEGVSIDDENIKGHYGVLVRRFR